jgi:L-glyceraldehyde 3-phosphate reductase
MLCKRVWLTPDDVNASLDKVGRLNGIAQQRGQKLSQLALAWVLRQPAVTSALIGASTAAQLEENLGALNNLSFTDQELDSIEAILES